jgi:hypothetical protein
MVITCKTLSYSARVHSIALVLAGGDRLRVFWDAGARVYESSFGIDNSGAERNGTLPSDLCAVTTRDIAETCP